MIFNYCNYNFEGGTGWVKEPKKGFDDVKTLD